MQKIRMQDALPTGVNDIFTIGKEGMTRERLPDGGLLCRDVPFARTGTMQYHVSEFAGQKDKNNNPLFSSTGIITVHRDSDLLFDQAVIDSFEAAPITLQHPPIFLNPDNTHEYIQGTLRNIRQGEGALQTYLLADLVIRGRKALDAVESKRLQEVSPGYESVYEPIAGQEGHYKQTSMIGNHLAIVKQGRGGRGVCIGDNQTIQGADMSFKSLNWGHKILNAIKTGDADGIEIAIREGASEVPDNDGSKEKIEPIPPAMPNNKDSEPNAGGSESGDQTFQKQMLEGITGLNSKFDNLVTILTKKSQVGDDDPDSNNPPIVEDDDKEEKKAEQQMGDEVSSLVEEGKPVPVGDAAFMMLRQNTLANAELLAPGLKVGTLDSKASKVEQRNSIQAIRVASLERGLRGEKGDIIRKVIGNKPPRNLTQDALFVAFQAAGEAVKSANNTHSLLKQKVISPSMMEREITPSSINAKNKEFWNNQQR